jgi:hypothetical protein
MKCEEVCRSNADCKPDKPICDLNSGECVGCVTSAECGPPVPFCRDGKCAQCLEDAQCGPTAPFCKDGVCVISK